MANNNIVVGLGFGDEGKGLVTSFLSDLNPHAIVIRHNGGQQAGHTVHYDGKVHVFSQLGAGTLQGLPTYFTDDCTFYPPTFLTEWELVKDHIDILYLHPETMITLPIDIDFNRITEDNLGEDRHGSVGMGFGATIERNERHFNLYAKDLLYGNVCRAKIKNIYRHYYKLSPEVGSFKEDIDYFMECRAKLEGIISLATRNEISKAFPHRIFETAQGILLDQHHGFFPNVTRSNTTSKNAIDFIEKNYGGGDIEIYYVTRCYQTRHGAGYMSNEDKPIPTLINNDMETNISHKYQGEFRISKIDEEQISYALMSDRTYSEGYKKNLVITCLDQMEDRFDISEFVSTIESNMGRGFKFEKIFISTGPSLSNIRRWR